MYKAGTTVFELLYHVYSSVISKIHGENGYRDNRPLSALILLTPPQLVKYYSTHYPISTYQPASSNHICITFVFILLFGQFSAKFTEPVIFPGSTTKPCHYIHFVCVTAYQNLSGKMFLQILPLVNTNPFDKYRKTHKTYMCHYLYHSDSFNHC